MKNRIQYRLVVATFFLVALTGGVNGQQLRTPGQAVDVVNGKTVVVAVAGGRLNVELQHIEVPAAGQPLHDVVRDHLKKLVVGRGVEFRASALVRGATMGQIFLNGVDVSQQMLRDGAAWLKPRSTTGQDDADYSAYADAEGLARAEKRGVWSLPELKPPWEVQLEKAVAGVPPIREVSISPKPVEKKKKNTLWGDKNPWLETPSGLAHGYNAASRTGFFGTTLLGVNDVRSQQAAPRPAANSLPGAHKMAIDITYVYTEMGEKGRHGGFVITVISVADDVRFLAQNTLKVSVDEKDFVIGKPTREVSKDGYKTAEKLTYRVDRSTIEKIANGSDVLVKVGDYWVQPTFTAQLILFKMLETAGPERRPATATNRK